MINRQITVPNATANVVVNTRQDPPGWSSQTAFKDNSIINALNQLGNDLSGIGEQVLNNVTISTSTDSNNNPVTTFTFTFVDTTITPITITLDNLALPTSTQNGLIDLTTYNLIGSTSSIVNTLQSWMQSLGLVVQTINVSSPTTSTSNITILGNLVNLQDNSTSTYTFTIPVATTSVSGLMPGSALNQISTNTTQISNLYTLLQNLSGTQLIFYDLGTTTPTTQQITTGFTSGGGTTPINQGDRFINTYNNSDQLYLYNATDSTWVLISANIQQATNESTSGAGDGQLGVVSGSLEDGKIYVEADGTMSLNGYDAMQADCINDVVINTYSLSNPPTASSMSPITQSDNNNLTFNVFNPNSQLMMINALSLGGNNNSNNMLVGLQSIRWMAPYYITPGLNYSLPPAKYNQVATISAGVWSRDTFYNSAMVDQLISTSTLANLVITTTQQATQNYYTSGLQLTQSGSDTQLSPVVRDATNTTQFDNWLQILNLGITPNTTSALGQGRQLDGSLLRSTAIADLLLNRYSTDVPNTYRATVWSQTSPTNNTLGIDTIPSKQYVDSAISSITSYPSVGSANTLNVSNGSGGWTSTGVFIDSSNNISNVNTFDITTPTTNAYINGNAFGISNSVSGQSSTMTQSNGFTNQNLGTSPVTWINLNSTDGLSFQSGTIVDTGINLQSDETGTLAFQSYSTQPNRLKSNTSVHCSYIGSYTDNARGNLIWDTVSTYQTGSNYYQPVLQSVIANSGSTTAEARIAVETPSITINDYNTNSTSAKWLITKEYADATYTGGGGGSTQDVFVSTALWMYTQAVSINTYFGQGTNMINNGLWGNTGMPYYPTGPRSTCQIRIYSNYSMTLPSVQLIRNGSVLGTLSNVQVTSGSTSMGQFSGFNASASDSFYVSIPTSSVSIGTVITVETTFRQ